MSTRENIRLIARSPFKITFMKFDTALGQSTGVQM